MNHRVDSGRLRAVVSASWRTRSILELLCNARYKRTKEKLLLVSGFSSLQSCVSVIRQYVKRDSWQAKARPHDKTIIFRGLR